MTLEEFLARVGSAALRRSGKGYLARCPAHDDHEPSLSIDEGDEGRILLHCWAGCETAAILDALGLAWRDLYPDRLRRRGP
jgi:putative DNA primase/helicase